MKCVICEERKPRRHCPGVQGEICHTCCGEERENSVDCPLDCVYLREARLREKPAEVNPAGIPFSDLKVPRRFVEEHEAIFMIVIDTVSRAILSTPEAIDYDVRDALESLIRTYKTLQSGLVYETLPESPVAADIYRRVQQDVAEGRKQIAAKTGSSVRDAEVLSAFLLMQRTVYRHNNGRRRGRAFIDHVIQQFPEVAPQNQAAPTLIVQP
jgi:hypothetical protein